MNPQQIQLVQSTFATVKPQLNTAATMFYERLFALDPSLRPLFKRPISEQGPMFMSALALAVNGLDRPETIVAPVQEMGQRHAGYGVVPAYYETIGRALLDTLAALLGEAFTPEVRAAWVEAYGLLSGTMQQGAALSLV